MINIRNNKCVLLGPINVIRIKKKVKNLIKILSQRFKVLYNEIFHKVAQKIFNSFIKEMHEIFVTLVKTNKYNQNEIINS